MFESVHLVLLSIQQEENVSQPSLIWCSTYWTTVSTKANTTAVALALERQPRRQRWNVLLQLGVYCGEARLKVSEHAWKEFLDQAH